MSDLRAHVIRLTRTMLYILALLVLGWGFTAHQTIFASLLLGATVSFVNALYTAFKAQQFRKLIEAGRRPKGSGMLTRFSMVALAAVVAMRYPDFFHIPSLAIGLMAAPIILFVDGVIAGLRNSKIERRRG